MTNSEPLRSALVDVLKTVYDPEIPVDIWELGLIYDLDVDDDGGVKIRMTLTSPMCPVAETLPPEVEPMSMVLPGPLISRTEARLKVTSPLLLARPRRSPLASRRNMLGRLSREKSPDQ